jgi:hypothetical protein
MAMDMDREIVLTEDRFDWSAAFCGLAVGLAVHVALSLLGLAVGAWSLDTRAADVADISLGTGIWNGASMILSAFVGAFVMARMATASLRVVGNFHALILWGVAWTLFAFASTAMAAWFGGLFSAFSSGLQPGVTTTAVHRAGSAAMWLFVMTILTLATTFFGVSRGRGTGTAVRTDDVLSRRVAV